MIVQLFVIAMLAPTRDVLLQASSMVKTLAVANLKVLQVSALG